MNSPFYVTDVHGQNLFNELKGHHTRYRVHYCAITKKELLSKRGLKNSERQGDHALLEPLALSSHVFAFSQLWSRFS
jgi:hypothetical protein